MQQLHQQYILKQQLEQEQELKHRSSNMLHSSQGFSQNGGIVSLSPALLQQRTSPCTAVLGMPASVSPSATNLKSASPSMSLGCKNSKTREEKTVEDRERNKDRNKDKDQGRGERKKKKESKGRDGDGKPPKRLRDSQPSQSVQKQSSDGSSGWVGECPMDYSEFMKDSISKVLTIYNSCR